MLQAEQMQKHRRSWGETACVCGTGKNCVTRLLIANQASEGTQAGEEVHGGLGSLIASMDSVL